MNKKIVFVIALVILFSVNVFAQEEETSEYDASSRERRTDVHRFAIGIGPEFNMNSPQDFAGGVTLSFDYPFAEALAVGLTIGGSYNFTDTKVLEFGGLFRYYLLGIGHTGFFSQADVGATLIFDDDEGLVPMFMGGIRAGHRIDINAGNYSPGYYIEPHFRFGFPFAFGVGVIGGIHIEGKTPEEKEAIRAAKALANEERNAARALANEERNAARAEAEEARRAAREARNTSAEADE